MLPKTVSTLLKIHLYAAYTFRVYSVFLFRTFLEPHKCFMLQIHSSAYNSGVHDGFTGTN
jgi:hypothetical protein